jgi:DNA repair photolyase
MIVSASYRTDIPAFYGKWFMNRLEAGSCQVKNPYGGRENTVSLQRRDVDGFVFWTKNPGPFLDSLAALDKRAFPFVVHHTITGYASALEQSVPGPEQSVKLLKTLSNLYGIRSVVWRYDPIIATDRTPVAWHITNFQRLAASLTGVTDEVIVSFAHIYQKTKRNLDQAAERHGISWRDPDGTEKETLAKRLAEIAADLGMKLTLCSQPDFLVNGIEGARCIDAARLSDVANRPISAKIKGNRPGCLCSEARDIGAYDSCPMGCAYCYAVRRRDTAQRHHKFMDENRPSLGG